MRSTMLRTDRYFKMGIDAIRRHGVFQTLLRLFYLRQDFGIWRHDLTIELPEVRFAGVESGLLEDEFEFRHVMASELAEVWPSLPPQTVRHHKQFLRSGYHCFAALHEGKVAGWLWWTDRKPRERDCIQQDVKALWPLMQPRGVYLWDALMLPAYRGKHIFTVLHLALCEFLQREGYEKTLAWTLTINTPAIRVLQRLNNEEVGRGCTERYLLKIERVRITELWNGQGRADS
jgi:RimJ/RimL family protein N-acetyltransferase